MNTDEVVAYVSTLTYLPGWEFEVHEGNEMPPFLWAVLHNVHVHDDDVVILLHFPAPESSDPPGREETVELSRPLVINPENVSSVEELEDLVLLHIARVQLHEMGELVKFDGRAPFHPHRRDGRVRLAHLASQGNPLSSIT